MDIKRYDFDYRITEVMLMLEEKQLYGTKALIRDLKTVVDEIQEIRAKAIDEFVKTICKKYTEEESKGNYKQFCANIKQELADIAEQMKAGGKNE